MCPASGKWTWQPVGKSLWFDERKESSDSLVQMFVVLFLPLFICMFISWLVARWERRGSLPDQATRLDYNYRSHFAETFLPIRRKMHRLHPFKKDLNVILKEVVETLLWEERVLFAYLDWGNRGEVASGGRYIIACFWDWWVRQERQ